MEPTMSFHHTSPLPRAQSPLWMRQLPVTELVAELTPLARWRLPSDPARMARSALGKAMFELLCARDHRACDRCDLRDRCEITTWYDPGKGGSHRGAPLFPETITPGGTTLNAGDPLRMRFWLVGPAPRAGLIVEALVRMARGGLGHDRVPHRLTGLTVSGAHGRARLVEDEQLCGLWPAPSSLDRFAPIPLEPRGATLFIVAPVRWRGANPHDPPTAGALLWAAINRARQLLREHGLPQPPPWDDPRAHRLPWQQAAWCAGAHRSSRHGVQDLSGWTGILRLGPEVAAWTEPLAACGVLGLGGATSAGHGRVLIDWL